MISSNEEDEIVGIQVAASLATFQDEHQKARRETARQRRWFSWLQGRRGAPHFSIFYLAGCLIVAEVCQPILDVLGPIYVARPSTADEWLKEARDFEDKWNMPRCLGAIDGKHENVECPSDSGSRDRNYKNSFSKTLLALNDANYSERLESSTC
ncbi:uncharacterized protein [Dermacentor albipictus]|uniref:uncharacterized protein n=1 Tax=Dermacentor albipictus TaxID=60249 RepID=UPI0038FC1314